MIPKLGEVHIPCDSDFKSVKEMCVNNEGWTLDIHKRNVKLWLKKTDLCPHNMFKVTAEYDDVNANVLFDVCMDTEYRPEWDEFQVEGYDHCYVTPFSNIGYFCCKAPRPIKDRDFVVQQSWFDFGRNQDKIIFSHSINHAEMPPVKNRVRAITYITACFIKAISSKSCSVTYLTMSDFGGILPSWAINTATKRVCAKYLKKLNKAALKYEKWKSKNGVNNKPWENPELLKIPKLNMSHINIIDLKMMKENMPDESNLGDEDKDDDKD